MSRTPISYFLITLKGMAMGAADVVPGVSGGTIAFISGIYQELIETIDALDLGIFKVWKSEGFKTMFKHYNLAFLVSLLTGVIISILSLAKLISYLLEHHPVIVWSFFFGLVVASILYIGRQITAWKWPVILALLFGAVAAYGITILEPISSPSSWYFVLFSGFIAIIAMILPGLSGSFILVMLGSYSMIMGTLTDFIDGVLHRDFELLKESFLRIVLFATGCILGLKVFSKALRWMFSHKKEITLALLTGLMIGSLNKIWPWKEVISTRIDRHGVEKPLVEHSILPDSFIGDPQIGSAVLFAVIGFLLIILLERAAVQKKKHAD